MCYTFEERADAATHFELRFGKPKPQELPFFERIWPNVQKNFTAQFEILRALLAEQVAAVIDEAPLPMSRERFLTRPIHAP